MDKITKITLGISLVTFLVGGTVLFLTPTEPTVGSELWCDQMLEKPNGAWTEAEIQAFAADCLDPDPIVE